MSSAIRTAIDNASAACLNYILGLQKDDGNWTEWELPPGNSSTWTTAFLGYKLRFLPSHLASRASSARTNAADWLTRAEFPGGGWGYNEAVDPDADSTAFGILFLSSLNYDVSPSSYERLWSFQQKDGGFSTYIAQHVNDSWGISHSDVSPSALLAILTKYSLTSSPVECALKFVLDQQNTDGLWNSFWWESPLYATEANLALLSAISHTIDRSKTRESILRIVPENAFETALLLSSVLYLDSSWRSEADRLIIQLIEEQQSDGSWKNAPILRITRRDCFNPWESREPGVRFADPNGLFTAAVVLEALSRSYMRLTNSNQDPSSSVS